MQTNLMQANITTDGKTHGTVVEIGGVDIAPCLKGLSVRITPKGGVETSFEIASAAVQFRGFAAVSNNSLESLRDAISRELERRADPESVL